jgi:hypothetical protein
MWSWEILNVVTEHDKLWQVIGDVREKVSKDKKMCIRNVQTKVHEISAQA